MKYLLTGGTGSWGNCLTSELLKLKDTETITIFSRGELAQVLMQRKFNSPQLKFVIGDVRDYQALYDALEGIDIVFHMAALKHVPVCEELPLEAVKTNITGTEQLIRACVARNVSKCIDVSTDKACAPNNLYGMTKAVGEKLVLNANKYGKTKFIVIRAGNVLGSNGSVVPLFIEQIKKNNTILVTNKLMTRYFMSLPEAIGLLLIARDFSVEADMFVMKMPSCTIGELAEMIKFRYGNEETKIVEVGNRPGEKLHEQLISEHEAPLTYKYGPNYYVVSQEQLELPKVKFKEYSSNSQNLMDRNDILDMLDKGGF
jgi:FlaA1/EpsC-like NDP-sugar epimerase